MVVQENKTYNAEVLSALDKAVVEVFGNNLEHFFSNNRLWSISDVRKMVLKIYHEETGASNQELGQMFGRHRATVIYLRRQADALIDTDKKFAHDYALLRETFQKFLSV